MFSPRLWERRSGDGQNLLLYSYSFLSVFVIIIIDMILSVCFSLDKFVTFETVFCDSEMNTGAY